MIDLILIFSHVGALVGGWYLHKAFGSLEGIKEALKAKL